MRKIVPYPFFALLLTLFSLQSCKDCDDPRNPDCDNYNPCIDAKATSATFTIREATYFHLIEPTFNDFLMDTDSSYYNSIYFEAVQQDADSFIWQVGSEVEPRYGKQINVTFPDNLRGTTFNVRLIVKRKPNTQCFPSDDGIDTAMRKFYFVRFNEPLSWEGTYYGSDDDKPDSMYTIDLRHHYDEIAQRDKVKIFGIPRGCTDTIEDKGGFITFRNLYFQRGGVDCTAKTIRNIKKYENGYRINYDVYSLPSGSSVIRVQRVFNGIKIN